MALVDRVRIYQQTPEGEIEVSNDVHLGKGKANPFGWSTAELLHGDHRIGEHYCGTITLDDPAYRFTITREEE